MAILTHVELMGRSLARRYFLPRKPTSPLDYDPYDKEACKARATRLLDQMRTVPSQGPVETCQRILAIIGDSYPTEALATEYFTNLEIVLGGMRRLDKPGQLVIGLGTGRCGSTSLAAMLATVPNSCCTHETPPLIFWSPEREQIDFHIRRFKMLVQHYSLVADVSHWWLNSIERIFQEFPEAKAVGLTRDTTDCALSFMRVQGFGKGSFNPWAPRGHDFWKAGHWDPTYPSYSLPAYADKRPDRAKLELITRYITEYNAKLDRLARAAPARVKLVRTEELSTEAVQSEVFQVAKAKGQLSAWRLNVKGVADGKKNQIRF
jgi:hypothetical protein